MEKSSIFILLQQHLESFRFHPLCQMCLTSKKFCLQSTFIYISIKIEIVQALVHNTHVLVFLYMSNQSVQVIIVL